MLEDLTFLEEGRFTKRDYPVRKIAEGVKSDAKILELSYWGAISRYIRKELELDKSKKDGEFRSRTASEILRSKHVNGCTDTALVFIVLARELGIPTRYVETLCEEWLNFVPAAGLAERVEKFKYAYKADINALEKAVKSKTKTKEKALEDLYSKWISHSGDYSLSPRNLELLLSGCSGHVFADIYIDGQWRAYEPEKGFTLENSYVLNGKKYIEIGTGLDFSEVYIKEGKGYRLQPSNLQGIKEVSSIFSAHAKIEPALRTIEYFNSLIRH